MSITSRAVVCQCGHEARQHYAGAPAVGAAAWCQGRVPHPTLPTWPDQGCDCRHFGAAAVRVSRDVAVGGCVDAPA